MNGQVYCLCYIVTTPYLTSQHFFSNTIFCLILELKNRGRLSSRGDHFKHRSDCLNRFSNLFGYLPLKTSRIMVEEEA